MSICEITTCEIFNIELKFIGNIIIRKNICHWHNYYNYNFYNINYNYEDIDIKRIIDIRNKFYHHNIVTLYYFEGKCDHIKVDEDIYDGDFSKIKGYTYEGIPYFGQEKLWSSPSEYYNNNDIIPDIDDYENYSDDLFNNQMTDSEEDDNNHLF